MEQPTIAISTVLELRGPEHGCHRLSRGWLTGLEPPTTGPPRPAPANSRTPALHFDLPSRRKVLETDPRPRHFVRSANDRETNASLVGILELLGKPVRFWVPLDQNANLSEATCQIKRGGPLACCKRGGQLQ